MKNFIIFILIVALLGGIGYHFITNSKTNINLAIWKGYPSFATFIKAIDFDEFMGYPVDETGFHALVVLAFMNQDNDKFSVDIVSGSKLTERYGVSESHRKSYNYLTKISPIKGATSYAAYFVDDKWVVIIYKEE